MQVDDVSLPDSAPQTTQRSLLGLRPRKLVVTKRRVGSFVFRSAHITYCALILGELHSITQLVELIAIAAVAADSWFHFFEPADTNGEGQQ